MQADDDEAICRHCLSESIAQFYCLFYWLQTAVGVFFVRSVARKVCDSSLMKRPTLALPVREGRGIKKVGKIDINRDRKVCAVYKLHDEVASLRVADYGMCYALLGSCHLGGCWL